MGQLRAQKNYFASRGLPAQVKRTDQGLFHISWPPLASASEVVVIQTGTTQQLVHTLNLLLVSDLSSIKHIHAVHVGEASAELQAFANLPDSRFVLRRQDAFSWLAVADWLDAASAGVVMIDGRAVGLSEGLLNERRASIHPFHLDAFRQAFPLVYAEQGYDFIDDGDVLTCPGGISTLTLATELIRAHAGDDIASTTCQRLSLVPHEIATPRPANFALIPDSRLRRAVMLIEQFLTRPLTTAGLAREVALSERQLNRLFHAEFGKTAREFIRSARLRYACWLLKNSQQSVTDIAQRMGFSDCAHFIRHFQTEYGCTPGVWRTSQS
ncbi:MAG: helix-turn-helix domain-containing protein [Enterobacter hormaechei]|nr:helix-turn-helix domain-containing protein [Enterobacter hormaechei]